MPLCVAATIGLSATSAWARPFGLPDPPRTTTQDSRARAADLAWRKLPQHEVACIDQALRGRSSVGFLIQRGVGPSEPSIADIRARCRAVTAKARDEAQPEVRTIRDTPMPPNQSAAGRSALNAGPPDMAPPQTQTPFMPDMTALKKGPVAWPAQPGGAAGASSPAQAGTAPETVASGAAAVTTATRSGNDETVLTGEAAAKKMAELDAQKAQAAANKARAAAVNAAAEKPAPSLVPQPPSIAKAPDNEDTPEAAIRRFAALRDGAKDRPAPPPAPSPPPADKPVAEAPAPSIVAEAPRAAASAATDDTAEAKRLAALRDQRAPSIVAAPIVAAKKAPEPVVVADAATALELARAEVVRAKAEAAKAQAEAARARTEADRIIAEIASAASSAQSTLSFIYGLICSLVLIGIVGIMLLVVRVTKKNMLAQITAAQHMPSGR